MPEHCANQGIENNTCAGDLLNGGFSSVMISYRQCITVGFRLRRQLEGLDLFDISIMHGDGVSAKSRVLQLDVQILSLEG